MSRLGFYVLDGILQSQLDWKGEPPSIIEDQVTYPIVTTLLAAAHVKAVRAQTMFGDSYAFVVFEDGTDLY